jgi:hypothetical protein
MRRLFMSLLALSLSFAIGCGDATEPTPTITGSWSGSGGGISVTLSLTQSGQSVTGNGSLSGAGGAAALVATGNFTNPSFSLTLSAQGYEDSNFAGTMSGNSLTGVINGSGFNQVGMTLTRK